METVRRLNRIDGRADHGQIGDMGMGVALKAAGRWLAVLCAGALVLAAAGASMAGPIQSRFFTASDGVRLHYLEAGPTDAPTLVLVPGWTMPAWIWDRQIQAFSGARHVVAFDPRGQGESEIAAAGYEPGRRGQDIGELIQQLGPQPVVIVGWSLGVLDALAYVKSAGEDHIAGLVLVDNSVGEDPRPAPAPGAHSRPGKRIPRAVFVRGMFRTVQDPAFLRRLTQASLRMPEPAAQALRAYPWPRTAWREALHSVRRPVLYVVRPHLEAQARTLVATDPFAESVLFPQAGHALFIDEPERFDAVVSDFLTRRVWPAAAAP